VLRIETDFKNKGISGGFLENGGKYYRKPLCETAWQFMPRKRMLKPA
jgi:hypothetical protein